MTISEIVIRAIPLSDCPVKRMHEEYRREQLVINIQKLLDEQKRILDDVQPISEQQGKGNGSEAY